jgi:two-component system, NarL family, sensor kinase
MLKTPTEFVVVFILVSVLLILGMAVFISMIIYRYQQKQNAYFKDIETMQALHENTLLQSQVEIQEQTLQNISREIHDNIGQKLTLAKLHLNGFDFTHTNTARLKINELIIIIGEISNDLSDLSHSMSSEIVFNNGLAKALEFETVQLARSGMYKTSFSATGDPILMESGNELIVFRMVQEALNNIVKHASASVISISLHHSNNALTIQVQDNGKGFNIAEIKHGIGLQNIKKRAAMLNGTVVINSRIYGGTEVKIKIPMYGNRKM